MLKEAFVLDNNGLRSLDFNKYREIERYFVLSQLELCLLYFPPATEHIRFTALFVCDHFLFTYENVFIRPFICDSLLAFSVLSLKTIITTLYLLSAKHAMHNNKNNAHATDAKRKL